MCLRPAMYNSINLIFVGQIGTFLTVTTATTRQRERNIQILTLLALYLYTTYTSIFCLFVQPLPYVAAVYLLSTL